MTFLNGITNLTNWMGNVIMPTVAGLFFALAVIRYARGYPHQYIAWSGLMCLMISGLLRGIEKFRIQSEDHSRPYRIGLVEGIAETIPPDQSVPLRHQRQRLEAVLAAAIERVRAEPKFPPSVPDQDLVNALAQYLELDVLEHQALLECDGVLARCRALIDLLEMKLHAPRDGWSGKVSH